MDGAGVEVFKRAILLTSSSARQQRHYILKDRDIKFNGTITAGNFEITGKDFTLQIRQFLSSI